MTNGNIKPTAHQADLAKLPRALAPLIERPQWCIWRWAQLPNGKWQKPPFQAAQPGRYASTKDPAAWTDYAAALAAVQAGHGDGISYILTEAEPYAAIDLDNCRHIDTHSIDIWAQNFLEAGRDSYSEVTPSGTGVRIWGLAEGATLNKKFTLNIDGKDIAAELFRRTNKALTITGYRLDTIQQFGNIDRVVDWAVIWGERRKVAIAPATNIGSGGNSAGSGYSVDEIEQIVRAGAPDGANRSDLFHTIVGHYLGCGWDVDQIVAHLGQYPDGIGARYIGENRLAKEVIRSASKYGADMPEQPSRQKAATPPPDDDPEPDEPEPQAKQPIQPPEPEPQDGDDLDDADEDDDLSGGDVDENLDDEEPPEVGVTANALCATVFEPPSYVVSGYIVEGLTLLAGKPKTGKSWLMLHVALAVARGAFTLGDIYCATGDVLYCALEDNKRRIQRRLNKLLVGQPAPKRLRILSAGEMPLFSQGGLDLIRAWIEQADLPKLVVIDVLAKVRDRRQKDQNLYDADYAAMQGLKAIADEYGIAIVVIHHLRKMDADDPLDQVSGTTGLAGSADTVLVLSRTSTGVVLHGRGRDIEDVEKAVQFDQRTCTWNVLGDASTVQYSEQRAAILAALKETAEPMSPLDIGAVTSMKIRNVRSLLSKLIGDGVIARVSRGRYALPPQLEEPNTAE